MWTYWKQSNELLALNHTQILNKNRRKLAWIAFHPFDLIENLVTLSFDFNNLANCISQQKTIEPTSVARKDKGSIVVRHFWNGN